MPITALILAAGRSTRMGRDKALLPWPDQPLAAHLAGQFHGAGVTDVRCVANPDNAGTLRAALKDLAQVVINPHPDADMLTSVRTGLRACPIDAAVLVHPVDTFALEPEIVEAICSAAANNPRALIRPTVNGKGAHPLLIPPTWRHAIVHIPAGQGLNYLRNLDAGPTLDLPLDEPLLLEDIDTPESYEKHRPR